MPNLLIIDDNPAVATALEVLFSLHDIGTLHAQTPEDRERADEPVLRQLEAFRRGDYDLAYTFASTEIQSLFDRPAFERMVVRRSGVRSARLGAGGA